MLNATYHFFSIHTLLFFNLITILAMAVGLFIIHLLFKFFARAKLYQSDYWAAILIRYLQRPLYLVAPLLTGLIAISSVESFQNRPELEIALKAFQPLLIIAIAWVLINLVYFGTHILQLKYNFERNKSIRDRKIRTQFIFIKRLAIIIIVVIAGAAILMCYEETRRLGTGLLTSAAISAGIIGIAAQKPLGNLLMGFMIAFTQPIKIGDAVFVENEWGTVEEINSSYVVIQIWDLRRLILPINYFLEKPFQNWTRFSSDLVGTVFLYTDYYVDLDPLRNELTRILESTPLWDKKVNVIQVSDANDKRLELRALVSAKNAPDLWDLRCYAREKLFVFLQENYPNALPRDRIEIAGKDSIQP